jgi:hypothetical protein
MKRRELERQLVSLGWRLVRHGSKHDVWSNGERQEAVPRHAEIEAGDGNSSPGEKAGLTMRFQGNVYSDGKFWLAEVPVFDAMTQGRTRKEALGMIADWFASLVNRKGFSVEVHPVGRDEFQVSSSDARTMVSLLLQRQRHRSGLSLAQAAQRLGAKSRNAYARYERGTSVPSVAKLDELLRAVAPGREIVLQQNAAA